jgi:hypothetical protein
VAWHGFDHPPSSSVDVKERVELYLYTPCRSSWSLLGLTLSFIPKEAGREEDLRLAGEVRSPKKWVEGGMNYGSWRLIDRSGKNS